MTSFGRIGVAGGDLGGGGPAAEVDAARRVEELGYATLWLPGGQGNNLALIDRVVRGTRELQVASGIISVDQVPADQVAAAYAALEADHPGRFVVGLGGAHGAKPLATLNAYLDTLDTVPPVVPARARILSALGPSMLGLARDRTAGAYPYLVTPEYTAAAREVLGTAAGLAVMLLVVPETDPATARGIAREPLRFLGGVPGYARNFARMGFTAEDVTGVSDRLVDAVTAWGSLDAIRTRVAAYHAAGADQVAIQVNPGPSAEPVATWWARLAEALTG